MMTDWIADRLRPFPFRGKLRLLDPLAPRLGSRSAHIFRSEMTLDLSDSIQRNIYLGTYEPRETAIARKWLKPGMTFVDAGANVGYYTALAASCVGRSGRVFAFEPQPRSYHKLVNMVERNHLVQVQTFPFGLSSEVGELPLYLAPETDGEQNATMVAHGNHRSVTVPVRTLDSCSREWGIDRIDLLKIDVEGFEPRILAGATALLLERRIKAILCEFNELWLNKSGSSIAQLRSMLVCAGFRETERSPSARQSAMDTRFFELAG